MNIIVFEKIVDERKSANPVWFGLDPAPLASEDDIIYAQKELKIVFPIEYSQFVTRHGGGYFAFGIVYPLDCNSDFSILNINKRESTLRGDYILFSENGSGDYYGFKITEGHCSSEVYFFDHENGEWKPTKYENLFSFLSEIALSN
jgi:hypothetical protein